MNTIEKIILISLSGIMLAACQNNPPRKDDGVYSLAVNAGSKMQRTKMVPVPMPGQLMSLKKGQSQRLVGEAAIEAANKKSVKQATSGGYINSIMTFDYMVGALYQIYTAPMSVTDIQFQEGEHIIAAGAGDTVRWQISKTYSGVGATRQEHLLIKPADEDLTTTLVVTTDQRTYHILLNSTPKTYMASVTWRYPTSDNLVTTFEDDGENISPVDIADGIDINKMIFNYEIKLLKGPMPDWYPKIVFNDGKKTFIKFSSQAQETPSLFVGDKKYNAITNFRVQGNYYIIDTVVEKAILQGGLNNKSVVTISSKKK
jgi:type IV secretion system protein TrbG